MTDYKIVCTDQEPIDQPTTHAHITAVGIDSNNDGRAEDRHMKSTVISNIRNNGDRYYTVGLQTGITAYVGVISCNLCGYEIIKSTPDATADNNLDYLRRCSWRS